jgi:hypothetical protein
MFGWKGKKTQENEPTESGLRIEEHQPTWSDGSIGPQNSVSRVYGRYRDDAEHEARLASAE